MHKRFLASFNSVAESGPLRDGFSLFALLRKRSIHAVTRRSFSQTEKRDTQSSVSSGRSVTLVTKDRISTAASRSGGGKLARSSVVDSHSGPFHQRLQFVILSSVAPLVIKSAGFSLPATCRHWFGGIIPGFPKLCLPRKSSIGKFRLGSRKE